MWRAGQFDNQRLDRLVNNIVDSLHQGGDWNIHLIGNYDFELVRHDLR